MRCGAVRLLLHRGYDAVEPCGKAWRGGVGDFEAAHGWVGGDVGELLPGEVEQRVFELDRVALVRGGGEADDGLRGGFRDAADEYARRIVRIGARQIFGAVLFTIAIAVQRSVERIVWI